MPFPERPCFMAFLADRARPPGEVGPLERRPLAAQDARFTSEMRAIVGVLVHQGAASERSVRPGGSAGRGRRCLSPDNIVARAEIYTGFSKKSVEAAAGPPGRRP